MNERIRELAEQAGIDFFSSTDPEYSGRVYCEAWTEQQQKFARLIVQECIDNLDFHGHDQAVSQLEYLKANRFGVK